MYVAEEVDDDEDDDITPMETRLSARGKKRRLVERKTRMKMSKTMVV